VASLPKVSPHLLLATRPNPRAGIASGLLAIQAVMSNDRNWPIVANSYAIGEGVARMAAHDRGRVKTRKYSVFGCRFTLPGCYQANTARSEEAIFQGGALSARFHTASTHFGRRTSQQFKGSYLIATVIQPVWRGRLLGHNWRRPRR
jgi:hypothetical protein